MSVKFDVHELSLSCSLGCAGCWTPPGLLAAFYSMRQFYQSSVDTPTKATLEFAIIPDAFWSRDSSRAYGVTTPGLSTASMNRSGSKLVSLLEWSNSWTLDLAFACCKRKIRIRKLEGSTSGCLVPDVEVASHIFFSVPQMPSSSTEERRVRWNLCRYLKTLVLIVETLLVALQKGKNCKCIASSGMWKSRKKKIASFFTGRDEALLSFSALLFLLTTDEEENGREN